ncbi:hypothetical protein PtrM4_135990 [Pyrenophora tritici-repentis]|uniref:Uncharacterized protein n=1 Tax=Pyrenophora tritici-repentis TaxID=45151 RepID=A0A834VL86_9PLEO|nr:hypothetical protein PtrM4_135990 [Pyrenophora tritici-repentis]
MPLDSDNIIVQILEARGNSPNTAIQLENDIQMGIEVSDNSTVEDESIINLKNTVGVDDVAEMRRARERYCQNVGLRPLRYATQKVRMISEVLIIFVE